MPDYYCYVCNSWPCHCGSGSITTYICGTCNCVPCICNKTPTYALAPCNHCYCGESYKEKHLRCCKCLDSMHVKFLVKEGERKDE